MVENMDWLTVVTTITTLFASGGWFIYYRANKRKAQGEATQSEAEGWAKMQEVYQKHIDSMATITQNVRDERDMVYNDNEALRKMNNELREKYIKMENQILDLRKEIARQGRRLEVLLPFTCGVAGCTMRSKVTLQEPEECVEIES